jgi:putative aminopeptidase FrvX
MEDFIRLLKTLSEARGPSGFEDEVREVVIRGMEPYVDEVVDRWGNPALRDYIINIAREVGIPYQLEVLYGGTTDAMAIAFRREGVSAVALSIPTRYVHSPVELLDVRDAVNAATLLRHVIEKTPPLVIDKFLERRVK